MKIFPCVIVGLLAASLAALGACGSDVDGGGSSESSGSTSSSSGASSSSSSSGASSSSSGAGGGGSSCGPGVACAATEYCDFPSDRCGANGELGACKPRPQSCPKSYFPTCGCDGQVHGNDCDSASHGADISLVGGCVAPVGTFACGAIFCAKGQQYCRRDVSDVAGIPDSFSCVALPAACSQGAKPTCACLAAEPCSSICDMNADGDLQLTCPGG